LDERGSQGMEPQTDNNMITLLYHDVVERAGLMTTGFQGADADVYKLEPDAFESQLGSGPSSSASVLYTFDDAGVSALTRCADLLHKHRVTGLFFVPTAFIGEPGFCSRDDLRTLHERGHLIGSHSVTHPVPMSGLSDEDLTREWSESRRVLEEILNTSVTDASVPGGFTSARVESAAAAAGYARLFTSQPARRIRRRDGMTIHGRFSVTRGTPTIVVARVLKGSQLPWVKQAVLWEAKKIVKSVGGNVWLSFRKRYFKRMSRA